MRRTACRRLRCAAFVLPVSISMCLALSCLPLAAQEKSVKPGINKSFENPNVDDFVSRFERDGREAYDHREEIVAALGLKSGMAVADVGAGTGLFTRLFAPRVGEQGKVYAVDISDEFVAHVTRLSKEQQQKMAERLSGKA